MLKNESSIEKGTSVEMNADFVTLMVEFGLAVSAMYESFKETDKSFAEDFKAIVMDDPEFMNKCFSDSKEKMIDLLHFVIYALIKREAHRDGKNPDDEMCAVEKIFNEADELFKKM